MRYPLLDSIRAIAIISMIIYHTCWDLVFMFGVQIPWFNELPGFLWEQSICFTFILLSGLCQTLAKHSFKDGITVSLAGLLVTLVSIIFQIGIEIYFGILTFIGCAILITACLKKTFERFNPVISMIITFVLFILTYNLRNGSIGIGLFTIDLTDFIYFRGVFAWILDFIGLPQIGFVSGDYFPLIPWIFLFALGFFTGIELKKTGYMKIFSKGNNPILEWIGRHSLIIYLIHQPIIYLVLSLIYGF